MTGLYIVLYDPSVRPNELELLALGSRVLDSLFLLFAGWAISIESCAVENIFQETKKFVISYSILIFFISLFCMKFWIGLKYFHVIEGETMFSWSFEDRFPMNITQEACRLICNTGQYRSKAKADESHISCNPS